MLSPLYIFMDASTRLIPCIILVFMLFRKFFRYSNKIIRIAAILFILYSSVVPAVFYSYYQSFQPWISIFNYIYIFIILAICIYFISFSPYQVMLVIFIILNYSDGLSYIKECLLTTLLYHYPTMPYMVTAYSMRLASMLLSFPFILLFSIKLLRPIIEEDKSQPFHRYLWVIPACFFVVYRIFIYPQEFSQPASMLQNPNILLSILWFCMTFLANSIILYMLKETMETAELQKQLELSNLSSRASYKQYEQLLTQIQEGKEARHNLRHNLLALKTYCKEQDYDKITAFINEYLDALDSEHTLFFCENPLINSILTHFYEIAIEQQIAMDIAVHLPARLNIRDEDICVIFGNAVENALEACQRQQTGDRYIHIKAAMFNNHSFTLQVTNSYHNSIRYNDHKVLLSSKRKEEGIGVASIQTICRYYQGICNIAYDDKEFSISIFLNELS